MSPFGTYWLTLLQSTVEVVRDIVEREGLLGLYAGLNSSVVGIAVTNGASVQLGIVNLD
jgi:hypothetical protein